MRFFAGMVWKTLVGAILSGIVNLTLAQATAPATSGPVAPLPAAFRNAPPDAVTGGTRDPALGDAGLARLIALSLTHSPAREQAAARVSATRRSFLGGDAEKRANEADLARVDQQLAEEVAHAWFDGRAADARLGIADVLDALAAQGLLLVNQRLAAGLATQADLERAGETAIKARTLNARATQERSAAVARVAALTGEQVADFSARPDAARISASPAGTPAGRASAGTAPLPYPIRHSAPAGLLERADVRAARIRARHAADNRDASATELIAFRRETVLKALEETENAYAAAVNARAQRTGSAELAATAARQAATILAQLEAGRVGRFQHIEAQMLVQDARLRAIEADAAYAKALATLERALGQ